MCDWGKRQDLLYIVVIYDPFTKCIFPPQNQYLLNLPFPSRNVHVGKEEGAWLGRLLGQPVTPCPPPISAVTSQLRFTADQASSKPNSLCPHWSFPLLRLVTEVQSSPERLFFRNSGGKLSQILTARAKMAVAGSVVANSATRESGLWLVESMGEAGSWLVGLGNQRREVVVRASAHRGID